MVFKLNTVSNSVAKVLSESFITMYSDCNEVEFILLKINWSIKYGFIFHIIQTILFVNIVPNPVLSCYFMLGVFIAIL